MKIISSTDNKYLGQDISQVSKGDSINIGDFVFDAQFIHVLENGNLLIGNYNYQLECEE